jgi:hypothetical protein
VKLNPTPKFDIIIQSFSMFKAILFFLKKKERKTLIMTKSILVSISQIIATADNHLQINKGFFFFFWHHTVIPNFF